jgi:hypothetical protein
MLDLLMRGVSTRQYEHLIPAMAETVGVGKSSVSRETITAAEKELEQLTARRFDEVDLLIIYIDGMAFGDHCIIGGWGWMWRVGNISGGFKKERPKMPRR